MTDNVCISDVWIDKKKLKNPDKPTHFFPDMLQ